jgi:hypothetical protein
VSIAEEPKPRRDAGEPGPPTGGAASAPGREADKPKQPPAGPPPSPDKAAKASTADEATAVAATEDNASLIGSQRSVSYSFIGARFEGATNFGAGANDDRRYNWIERLVAIEREHCASHGDHTDPVFHQACQAFDDFRIIVLRHQQGCQIRAEALLKRISHWASGRERACKLLGVPNDFALPLSELATPGDWPEHFHGSLIMLERRQEPMTTRFLSANNSVGVRSLCQRLAASDTRLIIALAAEWDSNEGSLDPFDKSARTLEVTHADRPERIAAVEMGESAFDAVPRIVAGLFQGLKVDEFCALVDELAAGLHKLPEVPPPELAEGKKPPPSPPTRLQRWQAGDIDLVLGELGVRYLVSSPDASASAWASRTGGYYLADERNPYGEPGWVIAHHPALLAGRADHLLDRYLGGTPSDRFREAFLAALARLEGAGVREVSADWLLKGWARARAVQVDLDAAARNFVALLEYLQPDNASAELARSVIDRLAGELVESELGFQQEAGTAPLHRGLGEQAQSDEQADAHLLWEKLVGDPDCGEAARTLSERQTALCWLLLRLSRRWPVDVARAVARVLCEVADASTPWRDMARALETLDGVPRFAAVVLDHLLKLSLTIAPDLWTCFAGGVAQAYEASAREALAHAAAPKARLSAASAQAAANGQRLAFACLHALAPRVYATDERQLPPMRLLKLVGPGNSALGDGPALIGRLLAMSHVDVDMNPALGSAGQGELPAADIVRFLRALTLGLQGDETLTPEDVNHTLAQVGGALRAALPSQLRRDLTQQARESLESLIGARDHFESTGERAPLTEMKRRIRATQAIVRNLAAPATSPA